MECDYYLWTPKGVKNPIISLGNTPLRVLNINKHPRTILGDTLLYGFVISDKLDNTINVDITDRETSLVT